MNDLVIKGTGNSRYLKSVSNFLTLYPTYSDFVSALIAGTLPIDINGFNSAGVQTQGTPLNKANLLKDTTASKYGLGSGATVNDVFNTIPSGSFPNMVVGSATSATSAVTAGSATNTDFTNATWTTKDISATASLANGTYEIQVNDGVQDKWFCFPLVTVDSNYNYYAYTHAGSASAYIEFECQYGTARINLNSTWQSSTQWRYRKIR